MTQLQFDGQMIPAWKWGRMEKVEKLELTPDEVAMQEVVRAVWSSILSGQTIEDATDFFKSGAGSMDVTRYAAPSSPDARSVANPGGAQLGAPGQQVIGCICPYG